MGRWGTVKYYKGKGDAKRAADFTRLARAITVAAREGGGDPVFNFQLRSAIDRAWAGNLPKDNVERAIKKGTGEIASERIEEVVYEGYGPGGTAVLVEALTDNRNRTSAGVKHAFSLHGGNLGATGSVQWMFLRHGVVSLKTGALTEEQEMALIEAGADDISFAAGSDGSPAVTHIVCAPDALGKVRMAAEAAGLEVGSAEFEWQAKDMVPPPEGDARKELDEMLEMLDDNEDVSAVYTNTTV
ncbi:MAG: hypothetical protein RLZZ324_36 [Candidatus Parcubacteria bacterium]|jgi:YebC/PmpR family DNA-binding regulatory protein